MPKKSLFVPPGVPMRHGDHRRPRTRREFLAQGLSAGAGTVMGSSLLGGFLGAPNAFADLSADITARVSECGLDGGSGEKIPFICIDLAGGANMAGSNVLIGGPGGQEDFLSTAGYNKQGLPGDMVPGVAEPGGAGSSETGTSRGDHVDETLGLKFHSDSAFLRGILSKVSSTTAANINGAVIPARSENDTGNNTHNPMYGIARVAQAKGSLLTLIGSRSSESGGNSMAPMEMILPDIRPTKIDRPSDVRGLVDVGDFGSLTPQEVVAVMESVSRLSDAKLDQVRTLMSGAGVDASIREKVKCKYVENAMLANAFPSPETLDPQSDPDISSIFSEEEFDDREFSKTASVMKLVLDSPANGYPHAGAGTIAMGGYDYHGGGRSTGEVRDFRAGCCMGACLEYAARKNRPLMLYVFSDGSLSSNGQIEDTELGRGKGMWTSDNQQTAASFFLVYNPTGRPVLKGATPEQQAVHQQLGYMRASGDVETSSSPGANSVNQLVQMVILNYMALHDQVGDFATNFQSAGLMQSLGSSPAALDAYVAFEPIVNGVIPRGA